MSLPVRRGSTTRPPIGDTLETRQSGTPGASQNAQRVSGSAAFQGRPSLPGNPSPATGERSSHMFLHNLRFWALGGPCISVLLLLGGRATALVAAFGVMACYCFDFADNAEGALLSLWGAVFASAGTLVWAGSSLGFVHKLNIVIFVLLVGVWATLQFRMIYRDDPAFARVLERLLVSCFPLPAAAILTWAGVTFGGETAYAAPCFALVMYAAVGLYAVPLRSGLGEGGAGGVHGNASRVPAVLCASMVFMPVLVQVSIDYRLLMWAGGAARRRSLEKVALAAALPWPLLLSLRPNGVLWWVGPHLRRRLNRVLSAGAVVALLVLSETSKSLVVLPVLRPFLFSAPRPPIDSVLVSAVLGCLVAAWLVQGIAERKGLYAARALTVASVRCTGLLLDVAPKVMPLFDLSALALSVLVFSGRRDLRAYVVGVAGASSFLLWFSWQTVWHLSFSFVFPLGPRHRPPGTVGGGGAEGHLWVTLQQVLACCAALSFGVLLVPGMVAFGARQVKTGVVFGLHAVVLLLLEIVLVASEAHDPWQLDNLYPLPLVALTGVLAVWMTIRLVRDRGMDPLFVWVPGSVGAAKVLACLLAFLAPTGGESAELSYLSTVIPVVSLAMAATAPFALFHKVPTGGVEIRARSGGGGGGSASRAPPAGDWSGPMLPLEGGLCVFFMASALWVCSGPVISPLVRELLGGGHAAGGGGGRQARGGGLGGGASEEFLSARSSTHSLAVCGALLALYALAVVARHFPDSRTARRSGAALLVGSMALMVLQPATIIRFGGGGGGGGESGGESWREYLKQVSGVATIGVGVLTLTGLVSPTKTLMRRAILAVAIGVPVGVWSALSSMPGADSITVSLSAVGAGGTYSCAILVLLEAALPRPAVLSRTSGGRGGVGRVGGRGGGTITTGSVLVELYVAVVAIMPVIVIAQGVQLLVFGPVGRAFAGLRAIGDGGPSARGAARFALATASTGHAIIALSLKLLGERAGGGVARKRPAVGGDAAVSRAAGEERWIPVMGNASALISTLGAFICCWRHLPGEGARALAAIPSCALLLMLQEDGRLFVRGTGFAKAVPVGALSAAWAGSAAYYILLKGSLAAGALLPTSPSSLLGLFGMGIMGHVLGSYRAMQHFHGLRGSMESRMHGEAAIALRAVSFWTADSPWQPLWNLALLAASLPSHALLAKFLWAGQGSSPQRASKVLAALAINVLPLVAGDLVSINLMGLMGLVGGCLQLWLAHERQETGMRFI